ncbi:MAG: GIY-YIG nuclease family protein [Sandaracinobacter sp.]
MTDDLDLDALADTLADFAPPEKKVGRGPREERIIAGFEEIQRFVEKHGHAPRHGESRDIFERIYATRLDQLRAQDDCRSLIEPLDHQGLLAGVDTQLPASDDDMDTDALLAELEDAIGTSEITDLRHVRTAEEKRAAEEIANRDKCEDFATFKPMFDQVQRELESGIRKSREFELKAEIRPGAWFIVGGQKAYVADMDEIYVNAQGRTDARLRVIFDNGTESNMLMRSLQRALHKDEAGRRISDHEAGPLFVREERTPFSGQLDEVDSASGTIYVLRSKSDHPVVAANRDVLHKIGVTGGDVERRIGNAKIDPTFLMADVEIVATYTLYNINRAKLENLIHRIFDPARLDIEIKDRFGNPVIPREWFLVPRFVVDDAVERIKDGTITDYIYNPQAASLALRGDDRRS